jgi:diaminopimelate epimerase
MRIPFWKMHGAANDFILVDDRALTFPAGDGRWIASICARRTGIGAEGLILVQPSRSAHFRMRFFNPDGSEVEMCGNGARCVARLANDLGIAPATMQFETIAGVVGAAVRGERVTLNMTPPKDWRLNRSLHMDSETLNYHFVNSGVPHAVVRVANLDAAPVEKWGPAIRYHSDFAPAGANANFVALIGSDFLGIRTYERGVEAETLACGTGIVAAGLIAARLGWVRLPVRIKAASGDVLEVNGRLSADTITDVTLTGPAVHVFHGEIEYQARP